MPRLADVIAVLDDWFDPSWAEAWDAVGLVCGDPSRRVERIHLAVDAVPETVEQVIEAGADLLITHHPLLLTAVHAVPADDPKGALIHRLIRADAGLFVAHTNADVARPGVSDALAERLGLTDLRPLQPSPETALDTLVVFVPSERADGLVEALAAAGAGAVGSYERCAWLTEGTGTFRPLPGSAPTIGQVGRIEQVDETRVEMVVPVGLREAVIAALHLAHPYEQPAFELIAQAPIPSRRGIGRVGQLPQVSTLREFSAYAAAVLPATVWGIRAAGDPERPVRTVAVSGGSCGSMAGLARAAGADAFLTADLKHHLALEAVTEHGPRAMGLVDAAHWATEAPWLDVVARRLRRQFGTTVEIRVSGLRTDPWTVHCPSSTVTPTDDPDEMSPIST